MTLTFHNDYFNVRYYNHITNLTWRRNDPFNLNTGILSYPAMTMIMGLTI